MIIWKPLVDECLQCVKEPSNKVGKNAVSLVRTNSHCKREVLSMYSRNLHYCIHISMAVSLSSGHLCNWKTCQP